ncbi:LacI family DNA-binding transcriptional regulator [Microlunatus parietis]|uniref:DNA-binding LacI/PurR family transcriptional regulator n=1 Tax=Microlunatus parietis TaxID=682979 RepID=A0A7Y9I738_9ACTN|nr:LacI family DNA-binding transcriptional regulator [Microlunatus parietis]NYE71348.1 DNA-binding LacI/PurR family transcriptional regulator [Microlunatus parietis]
MKARRSATTRTAPAPRATINDVATAAGVSRQTVTRAMNEMPGINPATKARVLAAAKRLRYRPSRFGRGLVKPEPRTLGLVVDDLTNPYYPELASAVIGEAAKQSWNVIVAEKVHATDRRTLLLEVAGQVDAVLGYLNDSDGLDQLGDLPCIQFDSPPGSTVGGVELDFAPAMAELVDHLLDRGVRHPVLLDISPPGSLSGRGQCFVDLMREHGFDPPVTQVIDNSMAAGAAGCAEILQDHPEADAIMAFNDIAACGTLKTLRRAGIDVPGQIKVAGFDGLGLGTYLSPELTTLALDVQGVAAAAVGLALGMAAGEIPRSGPKARRRVSYRLVVRESS